MTFPSQRQHVSNTSFPSDITSPGSLLSMSTLIAAAMAFGSLKINESTPFSVTGSIPGSDISGTWSGIDANGTSGSSSTVFFFDFMANSISAPRLPPTMNRKIGSPHIRISRRRTSHETKGGILPIANSLTMPDSTSEILRMGAFTG